MTKTDLVNYMAEETGMTKADATRALEAMLNGVVKGLKEEKKVATCCCGSVNNKAEENSGCCGSSSNADETFVYAIVA